MQDKYFPSTKIYAKGSVMSDAGRGVFASVDIAVGEVIELTPVIALPRRFERFLLKYTLLRNYYYQWGTGRKLVAMCLGFGSLYNHSYDPNASFTKHIEDQYIEYRALKPIRKDEEITINYNGRPEDKTALGPYYGIPLTESL